jgi:hypothetical protein
MGRAIVNDKKDIKVPARKKYNNGGTTFNPLTLASLTEDQRLQFEGMSTDNEKMAYLESVGNTSKDPNSKGSGVNGVALAGGVLGNAKSISDTYSNPKKVQLNSNPKKVQLNSQGIAMSNQFDTNTTSYNPIAINDLSASQQAKFQSLETDAEKIDYLNSTKGENSKSGGGVDVAGASMIAGNAAKSAGIGKRPVNEYEYGTSEYFDAQAKAAASKDGIADGVGSIVPFAALGEASSHLIADTISPIEDYGIRKGNDTQVVAANIFSPGDSTMDGINAIGKGDIGTAAEALLLPWGHGLKMNEEKKKERDKLIQKQRLDPLMSQMKDKADYRIAAKDGGVINKKATAQENIIAGSPGGLMGAILYDKMAPTPNHSKMDAKQSLKEGGQVEGPGTGRSDDIDVNVQEGSFVVPATNATIAQQLREQYLGDPGKQKMTKGGNTPVSLSNGEHLFTPDEVKILESQGINLAMLAPNAEYSGTGYQKGGTVRKGYVFGGTVEKKLTRSQIIKLSDAEKRKLLTDYLNKKNVQAYIAGILHTEPSKKNPATGKNEAGESSAQGWFQAIDSTHQEILDAYGADLRSPDLNEAALGAIALMIERGQISNVANGKFDEADKGLKGTWTSLPGGIESDPVSNPTDSLKRTNKLSQDIPKIREAYLKGEKIQLPSKSVFDPKENHLAKAVKTSSPAETKKESYSAGSVPKLQVEIANIKKKYEQNYDPELGKQLAKKTAELKKAEKLQAEDQKVRDAKLVASGSGPLDKAEQEYQLAKRQYDRAKLSQETVSPFGQESVNQSRNRGIDPKVQANYDKALSERDRIREIYKRRGTDPDFKELIKQEGLKSELAKYPTSKTTYNVDDSEAISQNNERIPDPRYQDIALAPTALDLLQKKKQPSLRKQASDEIASLKPVGDDIKYPEKSTPPPPTQSAGSKIFEAMGGYGGLMALAQTGFGLAGVLSEKHPGAYSPDATLVKLRDEAILDSNRLDPAIKSNAERNLELTRRGQIEQVQQMAGGDTGLAVNNIRRAGIDKNRGIIALAAMQEEQKLNKKQFAGNLAGQVAGQNRMAYEDKRNEFLLNQQAAAGLMNTGISNFIGATSEAGQKERLDKIDAKYSGTEKNFASGLMSLLNNL